MKTLNFFLLFFLITFSNLSIAEEKTSFWSNVDKFLGQIADGVSKKDNITGLRTIKDPFKNDEFYNQQGLKAIEKMENWARQNNKLFKPGSLEYERVKKIADRIVRASHYKDHVDKLRFIVVDIPEFNAWAPGGGPFFTVYKGLLDKTNDDELACVIGHELAHNSAGHIEENFFLMVKDIVGKKASRNYGISYTNIHEQEADRVGLIYTALAGYNPLACATLWKKKDGGISDFTYMRSHPAPAERAAANKYAAKKILKYYRKGVINPDVEKILYCNELYCNKSLSEGVEDGSGGGALKVLEIVADGLTKHYSASAEKSRQELQVMMSKRIMPPEINWPANYKFRYKGSIKRHSQVSGNTFAFLSDFSKGIFLYPFNGKVIQGSLKFHGSNEHGYWFRWKDNWGQGYLVIKEYTDGSLRGSIYMDSGSNQLGRFLGEFIGYPN